MWMSPTTLPYKLQVSVPILWYPGKETQWKYDFRSLTWIFSIVYFVRHRIQIRGQNQNFSFSSAAQWVVKWLEISIMGEVNSNFTSFKSPVHDRGTIFDFFPNIWMMGNNFQNALLEDTFRSHEKQVALYFIFIFCWKIEKFFVFCIRSSMKMSIRRVQYAPDSIIKNPPHSIMKRDFVICFGNVELEATLDKLVSSGHLQSKLIFSIWQDARAVVLLLLKT